MKDEALRLALEALEDYKYAEARTIIREALEQPEPEPFAWYVNFGNEDEPNYFSKTKPDEPKALVRPLYTSPPKREWQGLTDWEINSVANNNNPLDGIRSFARAIEAKLKAKNGFPQTEKNT